MYKIRVEYTDKKHTGYEDDNVGVAYVDIPNKIFDVYDGDNNMVLDYIFKKFNKLKSIKGNYMVESWEVV